MPVEVNIAVPLVSGTPAQSLSISGYSSTGLVVFNDAGVNQFAKTWYVGNVNGSTADFYTLFGGDSEYGIASDTCARMTIRRVRVSTSYALTGITGDLVCGYVPDVRQFSTAPTETTVMRCNKRGRCPWITGEPTVLLDYDPRKGSELRHILCSDSEALRPLEFSAYGLMAAFSGNTAAVGAQVGKLSFEVWFSASGMREGEGES
jgi:hypothetical protein